MRHPKKEIDAAVQYALDRGWSLTMSNGHAWGKLQCPHHDRDGCTANVYSTPRVPEDHAAHIRKKVDRCPHTTSV
ncbi:hypothetical protein Sinac_4444 [Singulisphaera acidiphila DSM 18658]|uniref:Uncharacterized protein n=1 Tax=Singulisphaera acidiphila (strain ATCC BAA-1392 / DSM 18658 / VKM B-2454 / MOB10) TaxID=886293 RepID=L0DIJ0_SINAD|nr:hypothetical protein Sinac_4444 [Singulisphaera acidiphila DSM 18658]